MFMCIAYFIPSGAEYYFFQNFHKYLYFNNFKIGTDYKSMMEVNETYF